MNTPPLDLPLPGHPGWDSAKRTLAAIAAYAPAKENAPTMEPQRKTNADIILAGVRSCFMAVDTINELEHHTHPKPQAMVSAARQVLIDWGLTVDPRPPAPDSIPDVETPPVPGVVPAVPQPVEPAELKWPPPEPALPAIYTENFYHPRAPYLVWPAHDGPGAAAAGDPSIPIGMDDKLVFKGRALWLHLESCWLMRMELLPSTKLTSSMHVWVLSKYIKPGDEIPLVIDASTQAKNNDP